MMSAAGKDCGAIAKTLHWLTVLLVILAWALGTFGEELSEGATRDKGLLAHVWIGLIVLVLAAVRIPWRIVIRLRRSLPPNSAGG